MKLPIELKNTMHKNGGRINRITRIGHDIGKPKYGLSRDVWYFIGDVTWQDGGISQQTQIAPMSICADDGAKEPEIHAIMALLNGYLAANGKWCDSKSKHEGWYANREAKAA